MTSQPMIRRSTTDHTTPSPVSFEVFVQERFSELELAMITATLDAANRVCNQDKFEWSFVSDTPGLVEGGSGLLVRAEPVIFDYNLKDCLIVTGGQRITPAAWMPRVRAMIRRKQRVVLLSAAATAYIKSTKARNSDLVTHWRDAQILSETGHYANPNPKFAHEADGIITASGSGYTQELLAQLLKKHLSAQQYSELGSQLLLQSVRHPDTEQPKGASHLLNAYGAQVSKALKVMENNIAEPISTKEISQQIGVSVRQLERLFSDSFQVSPARYYKKIRTSKAHALLTETDNSLIDVALATGFNSVASLSAAYRRDYGKSPTAARINRPL